MGCETSTEIDAIEDADVVYVLRMQRERMESAYVPSLREYAARWGVTPERVRPGQKVMHPGPINRGVEIDGRVADSPDSLILEQVRAGLVVRMAVLHDLLAADEPACASGRRSHEHPRLPERPLGQPRARRAARRRRVRRASPSTDGVIAAIEPRGGHVAHVLAPAFVDPHVHLRTPGPRGRGDDRVRHRRGGGRRLLRDPRDAEHRSRSSTRPPCSARWSRRRGARRSCPTGFMAAISKRLGGEELTEMGELADAGAAAFTDDGRPVASAGLMRRALQYGAVTGRTLALHCEEPTLSRDGQVHEGAVSRRARLRAAIRRSPRARWSSATSRSPATRRGRCT